MTLAFRNAGEHAAIGRVFFVCAMAVGLISPTAHGNSALITTCEACHGPGGNSVNPNVPIIAGYSYDGFVNTFESFNDDDRLAEQFQNPGEPATMMRAIAQNLTEEQIFALADYFTKQPFKAPKQTVDPALAEKGASVHDEHCEQCHSDGGRNRDDDAAILSGQWMPYLRRQLDNIMGGRRPAPRTMKRRLRKLDRGEINALLHFYASRGNTE